MTIPIGFLSKPSAPGAVVQFDAASQLGTWTLSESNLRAANAGSSGVEAGIRLDTPIAAAGNTYLEMYVHNSGGLTLGLGVTSDAASPIPALWWYAPNGYLYYGGDAKIYHNSSFVNSGIGTFGATGTIGMLIKNGSIYFSSNVTETGHPNAETVAPYSGLSGDYYPALYAYTNGIDALLRLSAADMVYPIPTGASTMVP